MLQDNGVGHICDGLYEQNQGHGLTTLVLWNNQITFQAMHNLAKALVSGGVVVVVVCVVFLFVFFWGGVVVVVAAAIVVVVVLFK